MTWFGSALIDGIALSEKGRVVAVIRHPSGAIIVGDHEGGARTRVRDWPLVRGLIVCLVGAFPDVAPMEWSVERVKGDAPDGSFVRERLPLAAPRTAGQRAWAVAYLVIAVLLPQVLADWLLRVVHVPTAFCAATFHVVVVLVFLALLLAYSALIARAPEVCRTFQFNAVLVRTVAAHEIDGAVTPLGLQRRRSFHPMSSGNFLLIALGLMTVGSIVAGRAGWPSYEGRYNNHAALAAFKIALLPLVLGLTHEIQLALSRLYRVPALRRPIEWFFVMQLVWVRTANDAQLALGYIAARELSEPGGDALPSTANLDVAGTRNTPPW
jgi:uncharacterized protein YqhQ